MTGPIFRTPTMYEWDCPNCGERIASAVRPPYLERPDEVVVALQNLVWAWDQREGVELAHEKARAILSRLGRPAV